MAQHGVEVAVGTEGPRGSHRPPCGGCLRLCIDSQESDAGPLREMRAGVHPGAGVWQVVAAGDCPSSPMGSRSANSEQPCAVQRAACIAAPLQRAVCWPPCVPGAGAGCTCVRQGSRQVCAERRKDSSCSCCRGDQETALVLASATQMATALMGAAGTEAQVSQPR